MKSVRAGILAISTLGFLASWGVASCPSVEHLRTLPLDVIVEPSTQVFIPVASGAGPIVVEPPRVQLDVSHKRMLVIRAVDYGFSVTNEDNGVAIQRALVAAKAQCATRLVLVPGVYPCYGSKGIFIEGFSDFTFDGAGAELVFRRDPTYPIVPSWHHDSTRANFVIRNCTRMKMGNFDMDWDWRTAPLATGARVTKVHVDAIHDLASYVEFELLGHGKRHPYYGKLCPVQYMIPMSPDFKHFGVRETWWMGTYEGDAGAYTQWVDPTHVRVYPTVFDPKAPHWQGPNGANLRGDAKLNRAQTAKLKVGDTVRLAHCYYGKGGFTLDSNVHFELHDVRMYSCFGFGVYVDGSQHNWTLRNVRFAPRDLRHPISCSADTVHFSHSCGGAIIDGFYSSHGQDDSINVHDRFTVAKPVDKRTLKVILARGAIYFTPYLGHRVELRYPTLHTTGWFGNVVALDGECITFDRDLPNMQSSRRGVSRQTGDFFLVFDRTASSDRLIFRNAVLEDIEQRCLFNASDITIENCTFRRTNGDPLRLLSDYTMSLWCEGMGVTNIVVRNCLFENNCVGHQLDKRWNMGADFVTCLVLPQSVNMAEADKNYLSCFLIEGCTFRDSYAYAIALDFGKDILFRNNRIECSRTRPDFLPTAGSIRLRHVENVHFENNVFHLANDSPLPAFYIGEDVTNFSAYGNCVLKKAN